MARKRSASKKPPAPKAAKISAVAVIGKIVEVLRLFPELAGQLPDDYGAKDFWKRVFAANAATKRMLECLRELPLFTELAPAKSTRRGWLKALEPDYGIRSVIEMPGLTVKTYPQPLGRAETDDYGPLPVNLYHFGVMLKRAAAVSKKRRLPRAKPRRWRDRFGPDEKVQRVRPDESDAWLPNPHRGTTTFQRFQGDDVYPAWHTSDTHGPTEFTPVRGERENVKYIPRTTLTYVRWPWRWLEPKKGRYNWSIIDGALKAARERGQTAQVRFQPYTRRIEYATEPIRARRCPPERSVNVPDWYWDTGAKWVRSGVYAANEPDSNDPKYLKHFGDFIRAFARRYDGHPDLESIDMAYAGFWGESGGNSTAKTARKLTDIYLRAFRKTQLLGMLGTPGCRHAAGKTGGKARQIGFRADCFGDLRVADVPQVPLGLGWNHTFDAYPKEIVQCRLTEAWKTAPVTMETCGNVATWFLSGYDLDFIIETGYKYHMSVFMPKNAFFPEPFLERLIEFDKKIGYRYALRQVLLPLEAKRGGRVLAQFFVDNVGCAPIYRPYGLAFRFRQGRRSHVVRLKEDIRKWLPGHAWFEESVTLPKGLSKGEVKVDLGIVDETGAPRVRFALDGATRDGWHPLTSIDAL